MYVCMYNTYIHIYINLYPLFSSVLPHPLIFGFSSLFFVLFCTYMFTHGGWCHPWAGGPIYVKKQADQTMGNNL